VGSAAGNGMSGADSGDMFLIERPFGRASEHILKGWWEAAANFVRMDPEAWTSSRFAADISHSFLALGRLGTVFDPHLAAGLFDSLRTLRPTADIKAKRRPTFTRPYTVLLHHFRHPQVMSSLSSSFDPRDPDKRNRPKQYLFSPLFFLRQMLCAPDYPASESLAHVVVRAEIFSASVEFAQRKDHPQLNAFELLRSHVAFDQVAASLQKASFYYRNNDTFYPANTTDFIVGHLLASRGLALLAFAPGEGSYRRERRKERAQIGRDTFLLNESLVLKGGDYEFRILEDLDQLPAPAELVNELDGFPLPLPGADVIFARGIRSTTKWGVVGRVSGTSGVGKTTLALSIATALAPLGVTTYYVTGEEDPLDLEKRVYTLVPTFIARTRTFPRKLSHWFHAEHLPLSVPSENRKAAFGLIDAFIQLYQSAGITPSTDSPPGIVPLFVVFDGVHELIERSDTVSSVDRFVEIRKIVERFRQLGAFVLIITAETDELVLRELDFKVDFVVLLENASPHEATEEPLRRFILHKTRLQYARHGAHILHISRRDGVKLYPRLSAQLDTFAQRKWKSPNISCWYDFLQTGVGALQATKPLVRIFDRSHILVSGRGSVGKAGFALKLLMKPIIIEHRLPIKPLFTTQEEDEEQKAFKDPRRVLVISFLYGEKYYLQLADKIKKNMSFDSVGPEAAPEIALDVLSFYAGYLAPEILLSKILGRIDRYQLEGNPYSAVLIDGLHNVFLQFPRLEEAPMIWPMLFEILRVLGVTTVITHTQFEIRGMAIGSQFRADVETAMHRVGPLLQTLVNAADFYIDISAGSSQSKPGLYEIEVVSALGQEVRKGPYFWNRENSIVVVDA
jgi:hypothetical protein